MIKWWEVLFSGALNFQCPKAFSVGLLTVFRRLCLVEWGGVEMGWAREASGWLRFLWFHLCMFPSSFQFRGLECFQVAHFRSQPYCVGIG